MTAITPEAAAAVLEATMAAALPAVRLRRDPLPSAFAKSMGMSHLPEECIPGPDNGAMRCEWYQDAEGRLMRVDVGPGAVEMVAFSGTGTVLGICRASTDPAVRCDADVADLKRALRSEIALLDDPAGFDPEDVHPAFAAHRDEIAEFVRQQVAERLQTIAAEREKRVYAIAASLRGLDAHAVAERFLTLEERLDALTDRVERLTRSTGHA